jgi:hypothetical protein
MARAREATVGSRGGQPRPGRGEGEVAEEIATAGLKTGGGRARGGVAGRSRAPPRIARSGGEVAAVNSVAHRLSLTTKHAQPRSDSMRDLKEKIMQKKILFAIGDITDIRKESFFFDKQARKEEEKRYRIEGK